MNVQLPARASGRVLRDDDGPLSPAILGSTPAGPSPEVQPLLFGIAPAESTVEVFRNATCTGSPIASGPATVFTGIGFAVPMTPNAMNTLTVKGTNTAGGDDTACSDVFTYRHDDIAPAVPTVIAVPGTPTQDPAPTVRGSAENGSTVNVYVDTDCSGTPVSTGTSADYGDADGLPLGTLTANTPHAVRVDATDAAGNVSVCSPPLTVTIDTVGPAAPTGLQVIPAAVTTDATPGLRGTAEAGSTVEVFLDNPCTGTAHDVGSAATFASAEGIPIAPALPDGDHDLYARATDVAGNVGACSTAEPVTIDTTAPGAPTGLALLSGTPTNDGSVRVGGSAEVGTTVTVYRDTGGAGVSCDTLVATGSAASFGDANGLTASPALADGTHVLRATATDSLGQESACSSDSVTVEVDLAPPPAPANLAVVQGPLTNDSSPALTGDAEAGTTVGVWIDAACPGTGLSTADATGSAGQFGSAGGIAVTVSTDGTYDLYARAMDTVGNRSACVGPVAVTVDTQVPAAPTGLAVQPSAVTNDSTPELAGSVDAGDEARVWVDSACVGSADVVGSRTQFAAGLTLPVLPDGDHDLYARAVDAATNASACVGPVVVTVDTVRPAAPSAMSVQPAAVTNESTPGLRGSAETGSQVHVFVDDPTCSGTAAATGTAVVFAQPNGIVLVDALSEGSHELTATATDAAGNESACSAVEPVVVDLTPPAAPDARRDRRHPGRQPTCARARPRPGARCGSITNGTCTPPMVSSGLAGTFAAPGLGLGLLEPGPVTVTARAVDDAGNVGGCSDPVTFEVLP